MIGAARRWLRVFLPWPLVTPPGFLAIAISLAILCLACHLLGWREHAALLSGTALPGEHGNLHLAMGIVYVLCYLALVLVAPVMLLGAGIFALLLRATRRRDVE
jgi:hypothetical protein